MKKILFLSVFFASIYSFAQTEQQVIKETIQNYKSHQTMSYDVEYSIKFFDGDEPVTINSSVLIKKQNEDTIFQSKFLYNRIDSSINIIKYYAPPFLYIIDKNEEKIIKSNASKGESYISFITGNIDGDVLGVYFSDIEKLKKKLENANNILSYSDSSDLLKIEISFPDDDDFYDQKEVLYIEKTKKIIQKITYQVKYKDQIQQNIWSINNVKFDQTKDSDFDSIVSNHFKTYKIEDYKPLTEEDYKLLEDGAAAPTIVGTIYPDYNKTIDLKYDKITILDFWYTSCMPCIKAIPHLNALVEKYKGEIKIIGVNPFEYQSHKKEKIEEFLIRTPIDYSILLTEDIPQAFNVKAFPTLYIIDSNGKVRYSQIGLSDNTYEDLNEILGKLINER
ncbi:MAG TPA: TlpA disulfide reductase family protein [Fluviicola sp.]|nr:TlpA disulfide reductase family protein [Fluviicola sp.]